MFIYENRKFDAESHDMKIRLEAIQSHNQIPAGAELTDGTKLFGNEGDLEKYNLTVETATIYPPEPDTFPEENTEEETTETPVEEG